jgi:nucleotide-binding universal stress UspA family protein
MYKKILVGYDDTPQADDALALARLLARVTDGRLIVAGIVARGDPFGARGGDPREADEGFARGIENAGQPPASETEIRVSSSPARGLQELAEEIGADLVVVGSSSHGGIGRVMLGTTAQRLLHGSHCAVALAPRGFREQEPGLRVIGVGLDGSPESKKALAAAIELGRSTEATLRVFTASDPSSTPVQSSAAVDTRTAREYFEGVLAEAVDSVPKELRALGELLHDDPAAALLEEAEKGVDLLCVGSRGYGPVRRVLLGSVSHALAESAHCPLLVVPRG